jgi:hypothetical protein
MGHRYHSITTPRPSETPTAPERSFDDVDGSFVCDHDAGTVTPRNSEFLASSPYKVGDVVFVAYGDGFARAYISGVFNDYDQFGDRRLMYRVHRENKRGDAFAKTFYYTWPGYVQRGYQRSKG